MAKVPKVDQETCIGCGTCVVIAPKTFKLGENGKAEVVLPPGDNEETIKEAVSSCAVSAISYTEE